MAEIATIIDFPNAATPEQRADAERCLGALEHMAAEWAKEIGLEQFSKNISAAARLNNAVPKDVRESMADRQAKLIASMIEQAWIEGAYRGCTGAFDAVRSGYDPRKTTP